MEIMLSGPDLISRIALKWVLSPSPRERSSAGNEVLLDELSSQASGKELQVASRS